MKPETLRYLSNLRDRLSRERSAWSFELYGVLPVERTLRYQHLDRVQYFRDSLALRPRITTYAEAPHGWAEVEP